MTLRKGLGDCALRTKSIGTLPSDQLLFPYPVYEFEFSQEAESVDALAYRSGRRDVEETYESSVAGTLRLVTQITNYQMFGLAYNQVPKTFTNITIPTVKRATVPTSSPYTISDAEIVSGNLATTIVAIEAYGSWGQAGPLTRGTTTPTAGQVVVAAGTLTFNAAQAGAPVSYIVERTATTAKGYGGSGATTRLGELEFVGTAYDNSPDESKGGLIWFPRLAQSTRPTISYTGDVIQLEIELKTLKPSGWDEPFLDLDMHTATFS